MNAIQLFEENYLSNNTVVLYVIFFFRKKKTRLTIKWLHMSIRV